jgi:RNA polymerase sigma-70 factor (ECF subfamily)
MTTPTLIAGGGRHAAFRFLPRGTVVDMHASTRDDERADLGLLMARVAEGDQQAFAEVYDATSRTVFGIVLRVLRDRAQAEEVTQEVYVDAWRQARRFDGERGSATSWLNTIAHRKAVDRVRSVERAAARDQQHFEHETRAPEPDVSDLVIARDDGRRVRDALQRLPEVQRTALELAYFDGRSQREVAEYLEVPLGTVKTRIRDAMKRLRTYLREEPSV